MAYQEFSPIVSVIGGGIAPKFIEEPWFSITPNVISILGGVGDNGGHTGELREILSRLSEMFPDKFRLLSGAIGDASRRMVHHIRTCEDEKDLFDIRWPRGEHNLAGHRSITDLLATSVVRENGSLYRGIQRLQRRLADYVGTVMPVTDDIVDLGILFENGQYVVGEKYIDQMQKGDSPIKEVNLEMVAPQLLPEVRQTILNSHLLIISAGTFHGSIYPPLLMPEFVSTIQEAQQDGTIVAQVTNIVNHPETEGWPASRHIEKIIFRGVRPDVVFVNKLTHDIPDSYERDEGAIPVEEDVNVCHQLVDTVIHKPLTEKVREYEGAILRDGIVVPEIEREVVRHIGSIMVEDLMRILIERNALEARRERFAKTYL